jgi:gliding motility-associated-like protein
MPVPRFELVVIVILLSLLFLNSMPRTIFLILFSLFSKTMNGQQPILQWAKGFTDANIFNYSINSNGRSIAVDNQGNVYSAGLFMYTVDFDPGPNVYTLAAGGNSNYGIYISKLDANGNFVWAKQIPELVEFGQIELKVDITGNVYLTSDLRHPADMDPGPGVVLLSPQGYKDAFVVKWTTNGDYVWAKQFGGSDQNSGSSALGLDIDPNGNVILCGSFIKSADFDPGSSNYILTNTGGAEGYIAKLTSNGDFTWAKQLGNFNSSFFNVNIFDIKCDAAGNIFCTGTFSGNCDFDPGPASFNILSGGFADGFVSKLNADGNFAWAKHIGNSAFNYAVLPNGIDVDGNNNVYTTGTFSGAQDFDPGTAVFNLSSKLQLMDTYVLKLDAQGNFEWAFPIGGDNNDNGIDLAIDQANNVYFTGLYFGNVDFDPGPGVFMINNMYAESAITKWDPNGHFVYAAPFVGVGGNNGYIFGRRLVTDPSQNIYMTGAAGSSTDFDPGPGVYTITGTNSQFPFVLKLSRCTNVTTANLTISTCNSYTLNSQTYIKSGIYIQTIPNTTGCDSIITINLTINRKFITQTKAICEGTSFYAGGANQTTAGIYTDTLQTSLGCDSIVTTTLTINPKPVPDLGPDRNLCSNGTAPVSPGTFNRYLWQDNSIQPAFTVNSMGTYWVTVTNANNCSATDTLKVLAIDTVPKNFLPANQQLCYGTVFNIHLPGYKNYLWNTGDITSTISLNAFGTYYLTVTDNNNCTGKDSIILRRNFNCVPVNIPTAFTPNQDGKNDIFRPVITQEVSEYSLAVFNRYGQKIFVTNNYNTGWNGTFNGVNQPRNAYIYLLSFKNSNGKLSEYKGTVTLIR